MNNEIAFYHILVRRGKVPALFYEEYLEAAKEVVASIPERAITPIEEMLSRLEEKILKRRQTAKNLSFSLPQKC